MDFRYMVVYAAVNVFCILTIVVIFSKLSYNMGSGREIRCFRLMTLSYLGFVLCELIWALSMGGAIPLSIFAASVLKVVSTILIPLMVYFWFLFAHSRFKLRWADSKVFHVVAFLPMAFLIVVYVISIRTGVVFSFGPDGSLVPGPAIALTGVIDNIYGIVIIVHAIVLAIRDRKSYRTGEYIAQILFIVICTVGGLFDAALSNAPIMPLAIALSFIYLLITLQEMQIYNDALTGLNNRRRADQFVSDVIENADQDAPIYLFLFDIDGFKQINDTKGHLEGDRALKVFAHALAEATSQHHGFVARWGGDEFLVVLFDANSAVAPDEFAALVQNQVDAEVAEADLGYQLSASMGYARCESRTYRVSDLVAIADKMLYQNKKAMPVRV